MKKFVEIEGCIFAIDSIEAILPPTSDKIVIRFKSGQTWTFSKNAISKLKEMLFQDIHLL